MSITEIIFRILVMGLLASAFGWFLVEMKAKMEMSQIASKAVLKEFSNKKVKICGVSAERGNKVYVKMSFGEKELNGVLIGQNAKGQVLVYSCEKKSLKFTSKVVDKFQVLAE